MLTKSSNFLPFPPIGELNVDDENRESSGKSFAAGHQVVCQPVASEIRVETSRTFVPNQLGHEAGRSRGVVLTHVLHGESQVDMVYVFDGDHEQLGTHLLILEYILRPYPFRDVFVLDGGEYFDGQVFHDVEGLVVHQADRHQVGRVVGLEKGEQLVTQVAV